MTSQNKDCRTCKHVSPGCFCERFLDPEVKQWCNKYWGAQFSDIEEPCPGWEKKVNDKSE